MKNREIVQILKKDDDTSVELRKKLCEEMPYLKPRNAWTGEPLEDYDYSWIEGEHDLPEGWFQLFIQMCQDIRQPLIDDGSLNDFYFTQVKEKFASMRCYNSGCSSKVLKIIDKYEHLSMFVCEKCGGKATKITDNWWITVYCDDCFNELCKNDEDITGEDIKFDPIMRITKYNKDRNSETIEIDCSEEWDRYLNG